MSANETGYASRPMPMPELTREVEQAMASLVYTDWRLRGAFYQCMSIRISEMMRAAKINRRKLSTEAGRPAGYASRVLTRALTSRDTISSYAMELFASWLGCHSREFVPTCSEVIQRLTDNGYNKGWHRVSPLFPFEVSGRASWRSTNRPTASLGVKG